ncbi:hypothetical protein PENTCL1PPCAC_30210, partial [Pristionchus entomophagus]
VYVKLIWLSICHIIGIFVGDIDVSISRDAIRPGRAGEDGTSVSRYPSVAVGVDQTVQNVAGDKVGVVIVAEAQTVSIGTGEHVLLGDGVVCMVVAVRQVDASVGHVAAAAADALHVATVADQDAIVRALGRDRLKHVITKQARQNLSSRAGIVAAISNCRRGGPVINRPRS